MDRLEESLKRALARKDPPPGFADRLRAAGNRAPVVAFPAPGVRIIRRWTAAAAMVVIAAGSGVAYRQHQGEVAKEQVMTAMRITAAKLNRIQTHVREVRQ